ncbi:methyltransferase domain-containing protein [Actinomadura sp. 9N215]|uniref:methyltransferase domain-containing protein n=1 Tax=Actinomadura sp. 9N215 TaxID=3375150 RepID=UPI0037A9F8FA
MTSLRDYIWGSTRQELDRMRHDATCLKSPTLQVLRHLKVGEGARCMDVSCGTGDSLHLLGQLAGPSGRVTGLDPEGLVGPAALAELTARTMSSLSVFQLDAEEIEEVPGGPYDLTLCRLSMAYQLQPAEMLRKMFRWTAPGGVMLVQEYDFRTIDVHPRPRLWDEFERVVHGVLHDVGVDPGFGVRLPGYFAAAGLGASDGTQVVGALTSFPHTGWYLVATYRSLLPRALELGVTTEAASKEFLDEIAAFPADEHRSTLSALVVGAWKRKPEEEPSW